MHASGVRHGLPQLASPVMQTLQYLPEVVLVWRWCLLRSALCQGVMHDCFDDLHGGSTDYPCRFVVGDRGHRQTMPHCAINTSADWLAAKGEAKERTTPPGMVPISWY